MNKMYLKIQLSSMYFTTDTGMVPMSRYQSIRPGDQGGLLLGVGDGDEVFLISPSKTGSEPEFLNF
jgi:hypothetical protein